MTAPVEQLPPDAPATIEDVRAARRWTWVALAWAVAASAIAAIALVSANNNSNDNPPAQTSQDVTQELQSFEKQVNDRLDAFSRRLNGTASDADVQKLDKRLTQVEDDASKAKDAETKQSDAITQLQTDMKDLQQRVDQLEKSQQSQQSPSTTP